MIYWSNGKFLEHKQPKGFNHSLNYGMCLWDSARSYDKYTYTLNPVHKGLYNIPFLREHLNRLYDGLKFVGIKPTHTIDEMYNAVEEMVSSHIVKDLYIRPIVYLGGGSEGVMNGEDNIKFEIFMVPMKPRIAGENVFKATLTDQVRSYPSLHMQCKNSANYFLGQVEIRRIENTEYDDVIFMDNDNKITEFSVANIFIFRDGEWLTPPNNGSILPGLTRKWLIGELGAKEQTITKWDLYTADCVLGCGTYMEIGYVDQIDHVVYDEFELYKDIHERYHKFIYNNS